MSTKLAVPTKSARRRTAAPRKAMPQEKDIVDHLAEVLKILADDWRLRILLALTREGEMHVTAIKEFLDDVQPDKLHSQPAVSHHLSLLRMYNLVSSRRDGKNMFYRVDGSKLRDLLEQFFTETGNGKKHFQLPGFSLTYRSK